MTDSPSPDATTLRPQIFAVTRNGPQRLALPSGATDVGDVLDGLPQGIYEGMRTFDHDRFFGLNEHVDRAERSMAAAGLTGELDRPTLLRNIDAVARGWPGPDCKLRFDVLAGPASELGTDAEVLISVFPFQPPSPAAYTNGVRVQLVTSLRRDEPHVKHASFIRERKQIAWGGPDNFEPILVDPEGCLLEGVMSNFFAVQNGAVRTAAGGVLQGVTRACVIRLARDAGIEVIQEAVHSDELDALDEAFFTTSVRSIVPIVSIANTELGDGRPGEVTRGLMQAYGSLSRRAARPACPPS
ncbi:MAG: hypothetical protein GY711_28400 [bacterium]|nr:hypothetical protein [bacterium]